MIGHRQMTMTAESSSGERKQRQTAQTTTSKTVSFNYNKQMQQKLTWESSENADSLYCFWLVFGPNCCMQSAHDGSTLIRRANIYHITAALWPGITIGVCAVCHSGRGVLRQPSLSTQSTHVTPVVPSVLSKLQWAGDSSTFHFGRNRLAQGMTQCLLVLLLRWCFIFPQIIQNSCHLILVWFVANFQVWSHRATGPTHVL